ncbi:MAG: hypothetical protein ABJG15_02070 [Hyphomonadaceae bacterium]
MLGSFKDRLTDMVKANVYDLLELAELMPAQSASELDSSERFALDQLGAQIARRHTLAAKIPVMEAALTDASAEAERAVENGNDSLARMAISKRLDLQNRLDGSLGELTSLRQSIAALETLTRKLAAARNR